jgi:hypothetical protein
VDDVMHMFRLVKVSTSGKPEIYQGPHVIRQWYDGHQLCIASLSNPEAVQQQRGPRGFSVPSILEKPRPFTRSVESLAVPPKYMCIHHLFDLGESQIPWQMTWRGPDALDQYFKLTCDGSEVRLEHTAEYEALVASQAAQMAKQAASR